MRSVKNYINDQLSLAFYQKFPDQSSTIDPAIFTATSDGKRCDYSIRSLIPLRQALQKNDVSVSTQELFDILTTGLSDNEFENFFKNDGLLVNLRDNLVIDLVKMQIFSNFNAPPVPKRLLVDYSSPNIAKNMHVGHLRSTIIGDSIANLYEFLGHNVSRINHIGDFGTQFGMIIQHLLETQADYETSNLSISDLQQFYTEAKKRFDDDTEFKQNAYSKVVLLQNPDGNESDDSQAVIKAWEFIKEISRQSYQDIYRRLDIQGLEECGESYYQQFIPQLLQELQPLLQLDDGRQIIQVRGYDLPLTVVKSDGGYTYDTTDLAAVWYRLTQLDVDTIIYVTDVGQNIHFQMIFDVVEQMGWRQAHQELIHVGFGLVLGADGKKFKSRSGDTVKLSELLDQGLQKAQDVLEQQQALRAKRGQNVVSFGAEEKQDIIEKVAYGSIKYADLASTRTNNYKFSFDKMINLKGNTGAYQLYEYVRIAAILRKAEPFLDQLDVTQFHISEKPELKVCKLLLLFPEIIESVTENLMFHTLCSYLYDLSNAFSTFHGKCRCLQFDEDKKEIIGVNASRLLICQFTQTIFEQCFKILGINTLQKM